MSEREPAAGTVDLAVPGRPDDAQAAADRLALLGQAFGHLARGLRRAHRRSLAAWEGVTADAFRSRLDGELDTVETTHQTITRTSRALAAFSTDLLAAQDEMAVAREAALAGRLTVAGSIVCAPAPQASAAPSAPADQRAWERVVALHGSGRRLEAAAHARLESTLTELLAGPGAGILPSPSDPGFRRWFSGLSPRQRQLHIRRLGWSMDFVGFSPLSSITAGRMPEWARLWECRAQSNGSYRYQPDNGRYGYVGGGTITGPGGAEWPIVMPYLEEDGLTFMADVGRPRDDGGIMQLDGRDPGWQTVASYRGVDKFQDISRGVGIVAGLLVGTGVPITVNRVDSGALHITEDGTATLSRPPQGKAAPPASGSGRGHEPVTADGKHLAPRGVETMGRIATGAEVVTMAAQAYSAMESVASHEDRAVFVQYQINDDGRTRALLHTYQAGTSAESGAPAVASFANTYDQEGYSDQYLYSSRENGALVGDEDVYRTDRDQTLESYDVHAKVDLTRDLSAR